MWHYIKFLCFTLFWFDETFASNFPHTSDTRIRHNYTLGFMSFKKLRSQWSPPFHAGYYGSAIAIAIKKVNKNRSMDLVLNYKYLDTQCSAKLALGLLVQSYRDWNLTGFVGPYCSSVAEPVGLLASHWNLGMVSYATFKETLSNKAVYDTFSRTSSLINVIGQVIGQIIADLEWKKFCTIYASSDTFPAMRYIYEKLVDFTKSETTNTSVIHIEYGDNSDTDLQSMFNEVQDKCRGKMTAPGGGGSTPILQVSADVWPLWVGF